MNPIQTGTNCWHRPKDLLPSEGVLVYTQILIPNSDKVPDMYLSHKLEKMFYKSIICQSFYKDSIWNVITDEKAVRVLKWKTIQVFRDKTVDFAVPLSSTSSSSSSSSSSSTPRKSKLPDIGKK